MTLFICKNKDAVGDRKEYKIKKGYNWGWKGRKEGRSLWGNARPDTEE